MEGQGEGALADGVGEGEVAGFVAESLVCQPPAALAAALVLFGLDCLSIPFVSCS